MVDRLLQAQDLSDREGAGKKLQLAGQIRRRSARVAAVLARLRGDG